MLGTQPSKSGFALWLSHLKKTFKPGIYFTVLSFSWNVHFSHDVQNYTQSLSSKKFRSEFNQNWFHVF